MNILRKIGFLVLTFLLDAVLFSRIEILGGTVDFTLAVIAVIAMVDGTLGATTFALILGILEDFVFARYFGVRTLGLFLFAYVIAEISKKMLDLTVLRVWLWIVIGHLVVHFSIYALNTYLGVYFSMHGWKFIPALSGAVLTGFAGLLFYFIYARGKRRKMYYGF